MNAIITRIRKDTTWREVVADYVANKSQAKTLNGMVSFLFVMYVLLIITMQRLLKVHLLNTIVNGQRSTKKVLESS